VANKCVGDPGGPAAGDGRITATDLICAWWTARANPVTAGTLSLYTIKSSECSLYGRSGTVQLGAIRFTGPDFPIDPSIGLDVFVTVPGTASYSPHNHAVIDGMGDPTFSKRLTWSPTCTGGQTTNCCGANAPRTDFLSTPYDTVYRTSDEILCGLEGVDWQDVNGDGMPDACFDDANGNGRIDRGEAPTGIWDGAHAMTVYRFINEPVPNGMVARTVTLALGRSRVTGVRFDLVPGDAYLYKMGPNYLPVTWEPAVP
jgi:hypothetical protein